VPLREYAIRTSEGDVERGTFCVGDAVLQLGGRALGCVRASYGIWCWLREQMAGMRWPDSRGRCQGCDDRRIHTPDYKRHRLAHGRHPRIPGAGA
jgi:hypothetical protein